MSKKGFIVVGLLVLLLVVSAVPAAVPGAIGHGSVGLAEAPSVPGVSLSSLTSGGQIGGGCEVGSTAECPPG